MDKEIKDVIEKVMEQYGEAFQMLADYDAGKEIDMQQRHVILNRLAEGETFEDELWRLVNLYEELKKNYDDASSLEKEAIINNWNWIAGDYDICIFCRASSEDMTEEPIVHKNTCIYLRIKGD